MVRSSNTGNNGEAIACRYLITHGLELIEANYACKFGEIDLVMKQQERLIFVEVKTRKSTNFGSPLDFISKSKQKRIVTTAIHYVKKHRNYEKAPLRFDAVGILLQNGDPIHIDWVENAFYGV